MWVANRQIDLLAFLLSARVLVGYESQQVCKQETVFAILVGHFQWFGNLGIIESVSDH